MANITVVGAGLAGAEAAYQLCRRGHTVTLREMKPEKRSPAHQRDTFAELVCSNSLRSDRLENAVQSSRRRRFGRGPGGIHGAGHEETPGPS